MSAAGNGTTRAVHFRDRRAPHQIQFQLERELMILMQPESTSPLVFSGSAMETTPAARRFATTPSSLPYDWETSRNVAPAKVSEYEAWKLMLRLLRGPASSGGAFSWLFGRK
jgi:hypothetical protein